MDLVIRGRSQDQRGTRPWDTGRTRVEPDRTGPEGLGRTRMEPGRTGPEGMEGGSEGAQKSRKQQQQQSSSVHQVEPEGKGSSVEWPSLMQLQQFQSQPASDVRVGQGARVSSSYAS